MRCDMIKQYGNIQPYTIFVRVIEVSEHSCFGLMFLVVSPVSLSLVVLGSDSDASDSLRIFRFLTVFPSKMSNWARVKDAYDQHCNKKRHLSQNLKLMETKTKMPKLFIALLSIVGTSYARNAPSFWEGPDQLPLVAAAAANLPDGRVLTWSAYSRFNWGGSRGYTHTAIYDPVSGATSSALVENTDHDM